MRFFCASFISVPNASHTVRPEPKLLIWRFPDRKTNKGSDIRREGSMVGYDGAHVGASQRFAFPPKRTENTGSR